MNARRRAFFCPLVELLEQRRLLACNVLFDQGILTVLGDKLDNRIDVLVGLQGAVVTCDGRSSGPFEDVQSVQVHGGAGRDGMRFDAEESLGAGAILDTDPDSVPEIVDFFGGPGIDAFHIVASPTQQLTVDGGQQADTYDIQFGRLFGTVRIAGDGGGRGDALHVSGTAHTETIEVVPRGPQQQQELIVKWEGPDFDASGNEVAIETIEIAHAGLMLATVESGGGDDELAVGLPLPRWIHEVELSGQLGAAPASHRLYRLFSLLEVGDGNLGTSSRGRIPGRLSVHGGAQGLDEVQVVGSQLDDLFEISTGASGDFLQIGLRDAATNTPVADISVHDAESAVLKGEGGDDEYNLDVNDDGVVTPIDVLAGGGDDKLTIRASLLAELIEIIGINQTLPDPLIRGTSVATGESLFEVSAFETEAITVDTREGDDKVTLREEDASLAAVAWTILTGGGNDGVDANLAAIPDMLHVLTGQGNDDVSLVFADNPNIPPLPRDVGAPPPEIIVDAGAGIDSVGVDVFGMVREPPSDLEAIGVQVTLVEVLASIFITGTGLLDLLTLFPLGALDMKQAVKDDRTGHIKTEIEMELAGPNLSVDLSTGATLDSILIALLPRADSQVLLNLDTGDAADALTIDSLIAGGKQAFELNTGDGDDAGTVRFGDGTHGQRPPTGSSVMAKYRSGSGDDRVAIDYAGPPGVEATLAVASGRGDDDVAVRVLSPTPTTGGSEPEPPEEVSRRVAVAVNSGEGDDRVDVNVPAVQTDGLDDLIAGAGPGAGPHVKAFDAATHSEVQSFFAYGASFSGGVRVASGDVNGDGVADIITGAGPGAGPHVKVFDGRTGAELHSFFAYGGFSGGVFVAAGDVNGDGRADVITGADDGAAGGHVKVFDGRTGAELQSFLAYPGFSGGVRVASGDVNADGFADVITGSGQGAQPHVKVFDGRTGQLLQTFLAYGNFLGGVNVGAGDVNSDGFADIITGADADEAAVGGHVKVFDGRTGSEIRSFFAFPGFAGGVRVAAGDINGDGFADIITGAGPGAPGGHVKVFDGQTHAELRSFFVFDSSFDGGVFVAAGDLDGDAPPLPRLDLNVDIQTGLGDDRVLSDVVSFEVRSSVRIDGGAGEDGITVLLRRLANPHLPPQDPAAALAALAQIDLDGGGGDDRISLDFQGAIDQHQTVEAVLRGGAGHDQVRARFDLDPHSTGRLSAQVLGEAGNDELGLAVLNEGALDFLFALLDGGPGRDRCRTTPNVIVKNCP